jgi:hypothetical protein
MYLLFECGHCFIAKKKREFYSNTPVKIEELIKYIVLWLSESVHRNYGFASGASQEKSMKGSIKKPQKRHVRYFLGLALINT